MTENIPGIFVPKQLVEELEVSPKGEALETGIGVAARTIKAIREKALADGVHTMAGVKKKSCHGA